MKALPVVILVLFITTHLPAQTFWEQTNGPSGGGFNKIIVDSHGRLFATGNALYRSTDYGDHWTKLSLPTGLSCIALGNNDDLLISGVDTDRTNHIYRSTDHGESWIRSPQNLSRETPWQWYVCQIVVNPETGTMLVAWGVLPWHPINGDNVYRSTDNGMTWSPAGLKGDDISHGVLNLLARDKNHSLYATTWGIWDHNTHIYRSTDDGISWSRTAFSDSTTIINDILGTANGHVLAAADNGVYRSTDGGWTWTQANTGFLPYSGTKYCLAATSGETANSGGTIFISSLGGLYSSNTDGLSWTRVNDKTYYTTLAIDSRNELFGAQSAGVWYSDGQSSGIGMSKNYGITWMQKDNGLLAPVSCLSVSKQNTVFAGTRTSGLFATTDKGNVWEHCDSLLVSDITVIATSQVSGTIFIVNNKGFGSGGALHQHEDNIYRSTDDGQHWTLSNNGCSGVMIHHLAVAPNGHAFAFSSEASVYRSVNDGLTWIKVDSGMPLAEYVFVKKDGSLFYSNSTGVFRSTDDGVTWVHINSGLPGNSGDYYNPMTVDNNGNIYLAYNFTIYTSTDNGDNWMPSTCTRFPNAINTNGTFYATDYYDGTYSSIDNGEHWVRVDSYRAGFPPSAFVFDKAGFLFAGTEIGVLRSRTTTISVQEKNNEAALLSLLEQNYPNPFSQLSVVSCQLSVGSYGIFEVRDMLGRVVQHLSIDRNTKQVTIDASNLPNGLYQYSLSDGENIQSRMMMVVR